jgi:hypothetical protein
MRRFTVFAVSGSPVDNRPQFHVMDRNVTITRDGWTLFFDTHAEAQAEADRLEQAQ